MTKKDLVKTLISKTQGNMSQAKATEIVNTILESIEEELAKGGSVSLHGFGTFKVLSRAERVGRNPRTNAVIKIAATKVVKFSPAKALKEAVKL